MEATEKFNGIKAEISLCSQCLHWNKPDCKLYDPLNQQTIASSGALKGLCTLFKKRTYFDEKNRFMARWLANEIKQEEIFVTMRDSREIYIYKGGIYRPNGETIIQQICRRKLGDEAKTHWVNEVVDDIKQTTYVDRDEFFNEDISLLCVENGILDLEELNLKKYSPDYHFLQKIPVRFDPNAGCPKIDTFLEEVLPDKDDRKTALEAIGYCLHRAMPIQKCICCLGPGDNGKSVYLQLIERFLGLENVSNVALQDFENDRFSKAELHGKLANIHADITKKALYRTGWFKLLTGNDRVRGQFKFQNPFYYRNYAKQLYSANELPPSNDETFAFYKRWSFLNFSRQFIGKEKDPNKIDEISTPEELSGLLNKAIKTRKELLKRGSFTNDKPIDEVRQEYIRKSDSTKAFIEECVTIDKDSIIKKKEFYTAYVGYCKRENLPAVDDRQFYKTVWRELGDKIKEDRLNNEPSRPRILKGIIAQCAQLTNEKPTKENTESIEGNKVENQLDNWTIGQNKSLSDDEYKAMRDKQIQENMKKIKE